MSPPALAEPVDELARPDAAAAGDASPPTFLIRGVNWLGDAVMTTPALMRLREARPDAKIVLLTPMKLRDLWHRHPAVDALITFSRRESTWAVARRLRHQPFQTAVVFPNSTRAALEVWLARIPQRVGLAGHWRRWLLTHVVPPPPRMVPMRKRSLREIRSLVDAGAPPIATPFAAGAHHLHHYLRIVSALGANPAPLRPKLFVSDGELQAFFSKLRIVPSPERRLFALNPGAEYGPAKRWPAERFIAAAVQIQKATHCRWIVCGSKADLALAMQIAAGIKSADKPPGETSVPNRPVINLAGATSLRELCITLKGCQVLLTNDTGPMHVAAAVGTPVVVPFGSTSPDLTGPGLPGDSDHQLLRTIAPCSPCFLRECPIDFRCMQEFTVKRVVEAVLRVVET